MQTELHTWLTGERDYDQGLALIKKHHSSAFLLQLLSSGPDPYNTPKLMSEILKLQSAGETIAQVDADLFKPKSQPTYQPDADLEKKMRIDAIIKQLWKEICHLHGQLSVLAEGEKLLECARSILVKNLKRQDLWEQLHYFEQNGVWFDDLSENKPKPYDLEQEIKNLMSSRAKARKLLKKPVSAAKRTYHLQRIAEFDQKIQNLKKLRQ